MPGGDGGGLAGPSCPTGPCLSWLTVFPFGCREPSERRFRVTRYVEIVSRGRCQAPSDRSSTARTVTESARTRPGNHRRHMIST